MKSLRELVQETKPLVESLLELERDSTRLDDTFGAIPPDVEPGPLEKLLEGCQQRLDSRYKNLIGPLPGQSRASPERIREVINTLERLGRFAGVSLNTLPLRLPTGKPWTADESRYEGASSAYYAGPVRVRARRRFVGGKLKLADDGSPRK